MPFDIKKALTNNPEEGEYIMRVDSVEVHMPKDETKYPSLMFKCTIVSPEVPESQLEQTYFRTLNPAWLRFIAMDLSNSNVIDIDSPNDLDPSDVADMARKVDGLMSGKTFRYNCKIKGDRPDWSLEAPTASY